jgi:hypothetical protein
MAELYLLRFPACRGACVLPHSAGASFSGTRLCAEQNAFCEGLPGGVIFMHA